MAAYSPPGNLDGKYGENVKKEGIYTFICSSFPAYLFVKVLEINTGAPENSSEEGKPRGLKERRAGGGGGDNPVDPFQGEYRREIEISMNSHKRIRLQNLESAFLHKPSKLLFAAVFFTLRASCSLYAIHLYLLEKSQTTEMYQDSDDISNYIFLKLFTYKKCYKESLASFCCRFNDGAAQVSDDHPGTDPHQRGELRVRKSVVTGTWLKFINQTC